MQLQPSGKSSEVAFPRVRPAGEQADIGTIISLPDPRLPELAALAGVLMEIKPPVHAWLIFHAGAHSTAERWLRLARSAFRWATAWPEQHFRRRMGSPACWCRADRQREHQRRRRRLT